MQDRNRILEKARKLKALAERGVDGEKENAKAMLSAYMKRHEISDAEISEKKYARIDFNSRDFLNQILNELRKNPYGKTSGMLALLALGIALGAALSDRNGRKD